MYICTFLILLHLILEFVQSKNNSSINSKLSSRYNIYNLHEDFPPQQPFEPLFKPPIPFHENFSILAKVYVRLQQQTWTFQTSKNRTVRVESSPKKKKKSK